MNVAEILNCIETSAVSFLAKKETAEIQQKIASIRTKQVDDKLYLAVIGEFSSGKSTFINGLLGTRLLKEAVTPTTACATYIQKKGKSLSINVEFFSGDKFNTRENVNFQKLAAYLHYHYSRYFHDLSSIIEALTSDQTIARTVKSLYINIPTAKIPSNIVIIDTPGFNPGADNVSNHSDIAKHVVENVADAAIVLTPQEQAMSSTLIRFLQLNLQRYIHRCVFVVTKMDVINRSSRDEILTYTKERINRDFTISKPRLYGVSAITMLPVKRIPMGFEQEWKNFQNDFLWFEQQIWQYLQNCKITVLTEHVYALTEKIISQCVSHLSVKQRELKDNKKFLEEHSVETIQAVCLKMKAAAQAVVNSSLNDLYISFSSAEASSRIFAESTINDGVITLSNFKEIMMPKIKNKVESEGRKELSRINDEINQKVKSAFTKQVNAMSRVFSSHYDSFPSLRPQKCPPQANVMRFNSPDMAFSIAISKIDSLEQEEQAAAGVGAIIGGIAGFLLGGPFGAAAGAAIGGGGGIVAGDKSSEMRSAAIPLVKDEISSYFYSLKSKVESELSNLQSHIASSLQKFVDAHVAKYGEAIGTLIREHRYKMQVLNNQIKQLNKSIRNLQQYNDVVKNELSILQFNNN